MDLDEATEDNCAKKSYTISCTSKFRDRVLALSTERHVTPGDLARAVLTLLPSTKIDETKDPGEPPAYDREIVTLKSGPARGRVLKRKPRLQVRLNDGYDDVTIRRALSLAVALESGDMSLDLSAADADVSVSSKPVAAEKTAPVNNNSALKKIRELMAENEKMKALIHALSFEPLPEGPKTFEDALYILGIPPSQRSDKKLLRTKFRLLAMIYHPDGVMGDNNRMSQINAALSALDGSPTAQ